MAYNLRTRRSIADPIHQLVLYGGAEHLMHPNPIIILVPHPIFLDARHKRLILRLLAARQSTFILIFLELSPEEKELLTQCLKIRHVSPKARHKLKLASQRYEGLLTRRQSASTNTPPQVQQRAASFAPFAARSGRCHPQRARKRPTPMLAAECPSPRVRGGR
jgi:hypothetical protein